MKTDRGVVAVLLTLMLCAVSAAPMSAQQSTDESAWEAKLSKENSKKPINDIDVDILAGQINAVNPKLLQVNPADKKNVRPYDPQPPPPPQLITDKDVNTLIMYTPPLAAEKPAKPPVPPKPPAKQLPPDDGTWGMLLLGEKPEKTTTDITPIPPVPPPPVSAPTQPNIPSTPRPTDTVTSGDSGSGMVNPGAPGKQDLLDNKEGLQAQIDRLRGLNAQDQDTISSNPNSRDNLAPDINYRQQQIDELNKQKNDVEGQIQRYDQNSPPASSLTDQEPTMGVGGSGSIPDAPPLLGGFTTRKEKTRSEQTSTSWVDMKNQSKDAQTATIGDETDQRNKNLLAGANAEAQNTRDQATRISAQQQDATSLGKIAGDALVTSVQQGFDAFGKGVGGNAANVANDGINKAVVGGPKSDGYAPPIGSGPADGGGHAPSGGSEPDHTSASPSGSGPSTASTGPTSSGGDTPPGSSGAQGVPPSASTPTSTGGTSVGSGGSPENTGADDFYGKAAPVSATRSTHNREAFNSGRGSAAKSPAGNATPAKAK